MSLSQMGRNGVVARNKHNVVGKSALFQMASTWSAHKAGPEGGKVLFVELCKPFVGLFG